MVKHTFLNYPRVVREDRYMANPSVLILLLLPGVYWDFPHRYYSTMEIVETGIKVNIKVFCTQCKIEDR